MLWLNEFLTFVFKVAIRTLLDHFRFLGNKVTAFIALVVGLIMVPVNWFLGWCIAVIEYVTAQLDKLAEYLIGLNFSEVQNYWLAFSEYFGLLDAFIPLILLTGTIALLLVMWVICFLIRVVIRCIPTAG